MQRATITGKKGSSDINHDVLSLGSTLTRRKLLPQALFWSERTATVRKPDDRAKMLAAPA